MQGHARGTLPRECRCHLHTGPIRSIRPTARSIGRTALCTNDSSRSRRSWRLRGTRRRSTHNGWAQMPGTRRLPKPTRGDGAPCWRAQVVRDRWLRRADHRLDRSLRVTAREEYAVLVLALRRCEAGTDAAGNMTLDLNVAREAFLPKARADAQREHDSLQHEYERKRRAYEAQEREHREAVAAHEAAVQAHREELDEHAELVRTYEGRVADHKRALASYREEQRSHAQAVSEYEHRRAAYQNTVFKGTKKSPEHPGPGPVHPGRAPAPPGPPPQPPTPPSVPSRPTPPAGPLSDVELLRSFVPTMVAAWSAEASRPRRRPRRSASHCRSRLRLHRRL